MSKLWIYTIFLLSSSALIDGLPTEAEDEWDALDTPTKEAYLDEGNGLSAPEVIPQGRPGTEATDVTPLREKTWRDYIIPSFMVVFLSSSLLFALIGARHNAKLTVAFEDQFCKEPEGILWKQFTRLGKGPDKLMVNESPASFKLHANGHRHLEGAVVTMTLLRRHEMMSYLLQLATKQEDAICLELYVKENSMPQMVLAIGTAANHKELLRTSEEVKELCSKVEVKEDRIKDWPSDLTVYAEHPSFFYDMMTKPMLAQVFGVVAYQKQRQYFRGLHISSDSDCSHSQVIRFWFQVPKAEKMHELLTLMTAVFAMVNQLGNYSISPERQKQGEQARQEYAKKAKKKDQGAFAKEVAENKKFKKRR